jgi:hypothetical protein
MLVHIYLNVPNENVFAPVDAKTSKITHKDRVSVFSPFASAGMCLSAGLAHLLSMAFCV